MSVESTDTGLDLRCLDEPTYLGRRSYRHWCMGEGRPALVFDQGTQPVLLEAQRTESAVYRDMGKTTASQFWDYTRAHLLERLKNDCVRKGLQPFGPVGKWVYVTPGRTGGLSFLTLRLEVHAWPTWMHEGGGYDYVSPEFAHEQIVRLCVANALSTADGVQTYGLRMSRQTMYAYGGLDYKGASVLGAPSFYGHRVFLDDSMEHRRAGIIRWLKPPMALGDLASGQVVARRAEDGSIAAVTAW